MKEVKLGDKVYLDKGSIFYNKLGVGVFNPINTLGKVVELKPKQKYKVKVTWSNGKSNYYNSIDLLIEEE